MKGGFFTKFVALAHGVPALLKCSSFIRSFFSCSKNHNNVYCFSIGICRPVVPGVCRGCHGDFGRSVNPISTKGGRLCPTNYTGTPGFSDLPTALICHGLRTPRESFFQKSWTFGLGEHFGLKFFEPFGVFSAGLSAPILVLWVPCPCFPLGTIQVLRHQRGGWVGSENGNLWWFTVL